jgi:hypothetical protein
MAISSGASAVATPPPLSLPPSLFVRLLFAISALLCAAIFRRAFVPGFTILSIDFNYAG